jgi:hypothetical protein
LVQFGKVHALKQTLCTFFSDKKQTNVL